MVRGLTRGGVNHCVSQVKRSFGWGGGEEIVPVAVHQALLRVVPLQKGRTEAPDPPPVTPVSAADIERTLSHLSRVVRGMVTL